MPPDDDFLQALSSELEIPLLLGGEGSPGHDETPDEIMKDAVLQQNFPTLEELGVDPMQWGPDAFPNLSAAGTIRFVIQLLITHLSSDGENSN